MNTFTFRDQRLTRVNAALEAINVKIAPVEDELIALRADPNADPIALAAKELEFMDLINFFEAVNRERMMLVQENWRVTDRTFLVTAGDWLWVTSLGILDQVKKDLVLIALGEAPVTPPQVAAAVEALPRGPGEPPPDWFDRVRAAVNDDEVVLNEIVFTGYGIWRASKPDNPPYVYDDVGVLLPIRLETLFEPPPEGFMRWNLLLRVFPDEASICRDNPKVSRGEQASLLAFWNAVKQPPDPPEEWLKSEKGKAEWSALCARVGPARAAWLVSTIEPQLDGDTIRLEIPLANQYEPARPEGEQYVPNRVSGMPPLLDVWVVTKEPVNGVQQQVVGTLEPSKDPSELELPLPGNIESVKASWWASWDKAQAVGMGGAFQLPEGVTPETISAIYVVGIGDEPPDAHFRAQVDAGELGILGLGMPTNTVQGEPAAELAKGAEEWRKVAVQRIHERTDLDAIQIDVRRLLSFMLMGDGPGLPFFPGADSPPDGELSQQMVQALYPALWGHWLHDLWSGDEVAQCTGLWAMRHLFPEGPLMPLRISDQPYGLLPTTALSQWQVGNATRDDPIQRDVEQTMAEQLAKLRGSLAEIARPNGTVVDRDTSGLVELLSRDASSRSFLVRHFLSVEVAATLYGLSGQRRDDFRAQVRESYRNVEERMERRPADYYLAVGNAVRNRLPLVKPQRMIYRDFQVHQDPQRAHLIELVEKLMEGWSLEAFYSMENIDHADRRPFVLPDSLFVRLLVYACQVGFQWQGDNASHVTRLLLEEHQRKALELSEILDRDEWVVQDREQSTGNPIFRLDKMPDDFRIAMERAFRSTLDTASHRIDPWVTGFAWQRLVQYSTSPRHNHRLGVYGWVDGPILGAPGPTEAGRLHAPSHTQALASLVLRDQYLSSARQIAGADAPNLWDMDIDSRKARLAEEIADEVRLGFNVHEIVGRRVENILGKHQVVKDLRTNEKYATHPQQRDPNEVCDGIRALKGLLKGDPEATLTVQELSLAEEMLDQPAGDPDFVLTHEQRRALKLLHLALDTYADLLMADGVMQVVNRQMDRAAETMDAASGFSRPPTFEFIRTPPSGYQLETRVLSVLPFVDSGDIDDDDSPCRIAEPSIAACIEKKLGSQWRWTVVNAEQPETVLGTVALDELGLTPPDALVLSSDFLSEAARLKLGFHPSYISEGRNRRWEAINEAGEVIASTTLVELGLGPDALAELGDAELDQRLRAKLGVAPNVMLREGVLEQPRLWIAQEEHGQLLGMATDADLGMTPAEVDAAEQSVIQSNVRAHLGLVLVQVKAPQEYRLARVIASSLGNRAAAGRDLAASAAAQRDVDGEIRIDLIERYTKLYNAFVKTVKELEQAANDNADDVFRTNALRHALRWGVTAVADTHDRDALYAAWLTLVTPPNATGLGILAERAGATMMSRLKTAMGELVAHVPDADVKRILEQKLKELPPLDDLLGLEQVPIVALTRAIAVLGSPDGKLSILARWSKTQLLESTGVKIDQMQTTLDDDWLTLVAPVRPPLARLEALQLEARVRAALTPFEAWTSSPGDPWRTGENAAVQMNIKKREASSPLEFDLTPFVAAYGNAEAWVGERVAVGMLDAFGEAIPMKERTTTTAFGFNAPAARAPQAILLAVPPVPRQRLENEGILQIVAETRELAHARAVQPEKLGELQTLAPTMWLQGAGSAKVHLEPWALFT